MKEGLFIALVVVFNVVVSLISAEYGIAQSDNICNEQFGESCFESPAEPETGSFFDRILAPLTYVWNAVAAFFKVVTFQIDGVPAIVGLLTLILNGTALWILIRMIRGGG